MYRIKIISHGEIIPFDGVYLTEQAAITEARTFLKNTNLLKSVRIRFAPTTEDEYVLITEITSNN